MRFKLIYENHLHYGLHVADIFLMLKASLESVGHIADIEYNFVPGHINIMLECFDDKFVNDLDSKWTEGTELIVIATEFLTGDTFNNLYTEPDNIKLKNDHNQRKEYWLQRYQNFRSILPYARAIWHPAEQQVAIYRKHFPSMNIDYLPHSYCAGFSSIEHRGNAEKDIDVLFTGTLTNYRKKIIESLDENGLNVKISHLFTAPFHREDLVSRTKIVLNIKQHDDWEHESVGRLHYHISNDSLIVTDQHLYPTKLHKYACTVEESWADTIEEQLLLGDYTCRAGEIRKQFAHEQPAEIVFKDLLQHCGF